MIDAKAFGVELAAIVKAATAPLIAENKALTDRLAVLEKRLDAMPVPKDGRDGIDGADGRSLTPDDVAPMITLAVEKAVAALPAAKDGADGAPGKDADPEVVVALVHERIKGQLDAMQKAVNDIPAMPELPDIPALIEASMAEAFLQMPKPQDGKDGAPGPRGEKGADGVGLAGALINRDGQLVVTLTNGEMRALGPVVGRDGAAGRDGADGVGFDDLSFDADEHGRPLAKFQRGDVVKTVALPCIVDRGVFKAGDTYLRGDAVSYGGSLWIAQKDAPSGRPDGSSDWRLAVKKGRDGRDTEAKKVL